MALIAELCTLQSYTPSLKAYTWQAFTSIFHFAEKHVITVIFTFLPDYLP
jgi:hypothetical protein